MIKSSLFWNIFIAISFMIEWFLCKKMLDYTSEKKISNKKINFCIVGIIVFANIIYFFDAPLNIRVIISMIVTIAFYKISYDVRFIKSVLISLIYWMLLIAIDALSISLTVWLNSINDMSNMGTGDIYRIESIILGKILLISALFLYRALKIKFNIEINKRTLFYIVIPIVANIASFFVIFKYIFNLKFGNLIHNFQFVVISVVLLVSSITLILIAKKLQ